MKKENQQGLEMSSSKSLCDNVRVRQTLGKIDKLLISFYDHVAYVRLSL